MKLLIKSASKSAIRTGFVLTDLVVVIATLILLSQILLPVIVRTRSKGNGVVCLNNTRQLIAAWQLYQSDNNGMLVEVYHGGDAQGGAASRDPNKAPWATGWLDWGASSDNTNTLFVADARYAKLAGYFGESRSIMKCPSDTALSGPQRALGWKSRARSYAANLGIGGGNAESGPWSIVYLHVADFSGIPDPAMTWIHIEENADSLNDPGFFNPTSEGGWIDQPANYHDAAANISFADGHAETHGWRASLTRYPSTQIRFSPGNTTIVMPGDEDIAWLSARAGLRNPSYWIGAPIR